MISNDLSSGMQNLMDVIDGCCDPIQNLIEGYFYRYNGTGDLFSKTFIFRVLEDRFDDYLILVNGTFETFLEKDFEFVDAVDAGIIEYLGSAEDMKQKTKD